MDTYRSVLFEAIPRKVLRQKHENNDQKKVFQKPQCIEQYHKVTQFIQSLSFNLLVGFDKRLLNGWIHKTQMRSLKTINEVYALSGDKYGMG